MRATKLLELVAMSCAAFAATVTFGWLGDAVANQVQVVVSGGSSAAAGAVTTNDGGVSGAVAIYNDADTIGPAGNATITGTLGVSGTLSATLNPADTTFAGGSLIANPAACGANEILLGAGVASVGKMTADCEGDIVGVKANLSGLLTTTAGITNSTVAITDTGGIDEQLTIKNTGSATCPGDSVTGSTCVPDKFTVAPDTSHTTGVLAYLHYGAATTQGAAALTFLKIDAGTNFTVANAQNVTEVNAQMRGGTRSGSGTNTEFGFLASPQANMVQNTASGVYTLDHFAANMVTVTQTTGTIQQNGLDVIIPSSAIVTGGTVNAVKVGTITTGPAAGTLTVINVGDITNPGAGTENAITVGTGWDNIINNGNFSVTGAGAISSGSALTVGECTMDGAATPTCTATVLSGRKCTCSPQTAVTTYKCIVATTTLTITSGTSLDTQKFTYICL